MIRRLFALFILFALPAPAFGWWDYGHQVIARIAWIETSPATRSEIRRLLARSHLLETPTCPVRTIEEASQWADCIKSLGARFSSMVPWHYQGMEICRPFDVRAACPDGSCVTAQIERNRQRLSDRNLPDRERVLALVLLVHFVGDLHQPMHMASRDDAGGSRRPVTYGVIAGGTNLHLAWDGYLPDRGLSTPPGHARGILSELTRVDKAGMRQGSVADWAEESWEVGRDHAYGALMADPCGAPPMERPIITEPITRRMIPIVRRQAARGGLRLARLLDEALG
jgi:hypothetical protein